MRNLNEYELIQKLGERRWAKYEVDKKEEGRMSEIYTNDEYFLDRQRLKG